MKIKLKELITEINFREPKVSRWRVKRIINHALDIVAQALENGDEVYLQRLGKFSTREVTWHTHKRKNRWNPFDNVHKRGVSIAPSFRFSSYLKRVVKNKR